MKKVNFSLFRILVSVILFFIFLNNILAADAPKPTLPGGNDKWVLKWADEFDYPNATLDNEWYSQNGPSTHILCSRWRENVVVSNGTLKLQNRKETRGGQDWTSGSIWTKQQFQYGYYECRYKYAAATGTNNSFWLMSQTQPTVGKKFEIDINEGHYPSSMATNIHNWTDITTNPTTGAQSHPYSSKIFNFSTTPDVSIQLEIPITTSKIRLTSNYATYFRIQEFRIYNNNTNGFPSAMSATADNDVTGLVNYARDPQTTITSSGIYGTGSELSKVADGSLTTHWVSQTAGAKWLQFDFSSDKTIGCIQFVSGWLNGTSYRDILDDYKVQYYNGAEWVDIQTLDPSNAGVNFGRDFHYLGLKWTVDSLVFYFDGKEMRSVKNDFCHSPAPVYLSQAIISWAGAVTDAINGTQMEVDYVRIYDPIGSSDTPYEYIKNGGFEVTATGSVNWEMTRELLNYTSYSWLKSDPGDKLVSLRVKSESSSNPFAAILGQKVVLGQGQYLFRFKARSSAVLPADNKFVFKFSNMYSDKTMFMNDSTPRVVTPTTTWETYSYKLNLKEDYSGKITFGFGNQGTFDLDSISLIRLGDAVISEVHPTLLNKAKVYTIGNKLIVKSETSQQVEIINLDGSILVSTQIASGENAIILKRTGIFIVRLRSENAVTTKKIFVSSDK